MKKYLVLLLALFVSAGIHAQQSRKDFRRDISISGSNYYAYPGPQKKQLTPAPEGYKPFYISHYGRHGSRYLIGTKDYDQPYLTLLRADSLGKLTAKGKEVLQKVSLIRDEARGRDGELTQRGAEQHKDIARRMYERFPEVFAGSANVDAKSTVVIRCILSMENALQQLLVMNPQLRIRHDASYHDMYYMNYDDTLLVSEKRRPEARKAYDDFARRHQNYRHLMQVLFNDEAYWQHEVKGQRLCDQLFKLASNVQSTELRHKLSLYDIFTFDEMYDSWLCGNAWWYIAYGPSPLTEGRQPFVQRNLLRKIISEADSCIALPKPGATLRFGHDTMVMPLTCLLDINGYGKQIDDLERLDDEQWYDYRIFPMACNIQLVFYRRSPDDKDVLFKVLQNEDEATLPIATDCAPYYHWKDFREFYLNKIDAYEAQRKAELGS
ncbi:histidine-type phosphatase [Prevotella sp. kh1p2]|uniref:histidine-type phosphatase n=1 Tax=Prevotella sp. kh1p2 TaxID=1761883 RepID=UPI0008D57498|nr:histidine-type phosphatase [Prevotella sp. kh1p2]SES70377.1 Histidine phosphatase superfamily (branch 2) [Prevotella sp. kh1p2]SNU10364.1 Histidine phosphatase superfamily (branch 2) [Prevotellaceae bacterium KH2P17]